MMYLILAPSDKRILHISQTLSVLPNGNYLIHNGIVAIPSKICELEEVNVVPDDVISEKWRYINGEFKLNPNWTDPTQDSSADIAEIKAILTGEVE